MSQLIISPKDDYVFDLEGIDLPGWSLSIEEYVVYLSSIDNYIEIPEKSNFNVITTILGENSVKLTYEDSFIILNLKQFKEIKLLIDQHI